MRGSSKPWAWRPGSCYSRWNTRSGGVLEIRSYLVCRMTNTYIPATSTACIYWLADITVCAALRSTSENFVPCYSFGLPFQLWILCQGPGVITCVYNVVEIP